MICVSNFRCSSQLINVPMHFAQITTINESYDDSNSVNFSGITLTYASYLVAWRDGLRLSQFEIVIRSVTALLANQHVALEFEIYVNMHLINVKVQP